jgi:hypothetical protein
VRSAPVAKLQRQVVSTLLATLGPQPSVSALGVTSLIDSDLSFARIREPHQRLRFHRGSVRGSHPSMTTVTAHTSPG